MTPRIFLAAALAALTFAASAHADAGAPDPNFGTAGVLRMETSGLQPETGAALQADGKLIVTGGGVNDAIARIRRLKDNGTPDGDFGDAGTVTIDGTGTDRLNAVLVQPDGKILVGGSSGNSAVLYRFSDRGAPDQGFGNGGKVTLPALRVGAETALDIAVRDGKIVAVGQSELKAAVWKRNLADGSADVAAVIPITGGGDNPFGDRAVGVAIQADGRIDVAGSTSASFNGFVARLNTGLGLDPTFQGGLVQLNNGAIDTEASIALQADGKIVVAGRTTSGFNDPGNIIVTRLTTGGVPDQTFNGNGVRVIDSGGDEGASRILVQPDGKLVIVGSTLGVTAFYRLTTGGLPDPTFDVDGAIGIPGADTSSDAVLQADGKIVSVGAIQGLGTAIRVFGDPVAVAVDKDGTGRGAVVTDPIGVNCGLTCSAKFDTGTRVTLTAVPNPGSHFAGWRGCASAGPTCTFDLRVPTLVTAVFDADTTTNGGGGTGGGGAGTGGGGGAGGGGGTGGGGTSHPGAPPAITGATLSATRFRVSSRKTAISAAVKRGTSVRFTLSADAATTLTIARGGRTAMTLTRARTTRGANLIGFTGRTAKKTLKPGRYTLTLVATNNRQRSRPVTLSFTVLSGR